MNTFLYPLTLLLGIAGMLACAPAFAQDEDEDAADLQSYSVGDRRPDPTVDREKIVIERPSFKNTFRLEPPKPALSGIELAKPKLEVLVDPKRNDRSADSTTRTAEAGGTTPSVIPGYAGVTRAIQPLNMQPPQYPRDAYRRRQEGFVVIEFTINADGTTENLNIVESSPRGVFDMEARRAVARWTFKPALENGRPVPQRIRHTLEFNLQNR